MGDMLREIVEQVNVGIVIVGDDLKIRLWNRWMENVSGVDGYRACSLRLPDLMPSLRASGLEHRILDALSLEREDELRLTGASQLPWAADIKVTIQPMTPQYHIDSVAPHQGGMEHRCLVQFRNMAASVDSAEVANRHLASNHPVEQELADLEGRRVLLADDNPITRSMIHRPLEDAGFIVQEAANGHEAVRVVQLSDMFDFVIMDICMPLMDGVEAAAQIRSLYGEKGETPILALTTSATSTDRERFQNAGFTDFIMKPVQEHALISKCKELIDLNRPAFSARHDVNWLDQPYA